MEFTGKKVIITGANGLVGLPAVKKCLDEGAKVFAVDLKYHIVKSIYNGDANKFKSLMLKKELVSYLMK
jgi:NAD(P)-dependent dehydrogenase (short-subunit alcohol dehydrogenase family)